ncbi:MAG TPA: helix-turn-helix transcriptional regulator [Puia sp.]|nr:helix-turn-helix transcriptional regulator [Puia sp.]
MLLLKTIVLLGALQGLIVSGLLRASGRFRPEERVSRRLLAALIFWIALACLNIFLIHEPFWTATLPGNILAAVIPLIVIMPLGPLIYFYVRSCEESDFRLTRRRRTLFIPVVIDLFQHAFLLLFLIALIVRLVPPNKYPVGTWEDYYDQYADIPRWISLTIYLRLASRYLRRRRKASIPADPEDSRRMAWLRTLLRVFWAFDLLWLAHLIPYELPKIGDELIDRFDWYPLYIPLVIIIYFLGAKGYFISTAHRKQPAPNMPDKKPAPLIIPKEKMDHMIAVLRKSMEEDRIWLDTDLNLGKLAQYCGVAPKTLSMILNQHLGMSFTDYVNHYRIDAVKERIVRPESRQLTVAGLAYECGFNSLPTFQRAFKATTGMSPKEYMYRTLINSGSE